ncbi:MAG: hypothetical protein ABI220_04560 [Candidatus Saccharimonadales bacterium]
MNHEKVPKKQPAESGAEKLSRWGRDVNALGALAIAGVAAVIPGPNIVLASWAGLNAAQAGGFELLRQHSKKKRLKKNKGHK